MFGLFNRKVVGEAQPKSQGAVAAGTDWQSILTKADAGHVRYNEAVAALNVKVICDLSSLVRDRSKYESFRREAIALALSIRDERYRTFAIKQLEEHSPALRADSKRPDGNKSLLFPGIRPRPSWFPPSPPVKAYED